MRAGLGYDSHRFEKGRPLILGGVEIPYELGLIGWSDADVLTHAIVDAMLGAAAVGDIGEHFPDTDSKYRNASSIALLIAAKNIIGESGYRPVNADAVIIMDEPKIKPYREAIRKNIAEALELQVDAVSVKAKTSEGMGFVGRREGVAAYAVVLIEETRQAL